MFWLKLPFFVILMSQISILRTYLRNSGSFFIKNVIVFKNLATIKECKNFKLKERPLQGQNAWEGSTRDGKVKRVNGGQPQDFRIDGGEAKPPIQGQI